MPVRLCACVFVFPIKFSVALISIFLSKIPFFKLKTEQMKDISSGVMFLSYSLIANEAGSKTSTSRLDQLLDWCKGDFDSCIIFDECHKAKNTTAQTTPAKASKTAAAVTLLQTKVPNARVVYASATGKRDICLNSFETCLIFCLFTTA